jgi:riboflavin kinase/FMN adenylyltransferase
MPGTVITIGNFDGVHVGHRALLARARALAGSGGRVVAMSFDPHPATVLAPGSAPARIEPFSVRRERLLAVADEVVTLDPRNGMLRLTPREFVAAVVERYRPTAFVEGPDFHFGAKRAGNPEVLAALGREMGFAVEIEHPVEVGLVDGSLVRASSTLARLLIGHGRVGDAACVLGRAVELRGEVTRGDRRGRQVGFPTANLTLGAEWAGAVLPMDGVYAGTGVLPDGRRVDAMVNIGTRPTVAGVDHRIEAHLLQEASADGVWAPIRGLPEYGWAMRLELRAWLRDQVRFSGFPALVEQLHRDRARALALS